MTNSWIAYTISVLDELWQLEDRLNIARSWHYAYDIQFEIDELS